MLPKGIRTSHLRNGSSRRKEAPIFLRFEPRHLGCYGVLKLPRTFYFFSCNANQVCIW